MTIQTTGSVPPAPAPASAARPGEVSTGFVLRYAAGFIGIYTALMTPVAITLAVRVGLLDPDNKGADLGLILGVGALIALIANPVFGLISDRTTSRFGRRRPWLVFGVVAGFACAAVIAWAGSIWTIAIAWWVAQVVYNAALAAIVALVPDQVPEAQRARISALSGMALYIALLLGSGILSLMGDSGPAMFLVPALVAVVTVGWLVTGIEDRPVARAAAAADRGNAVLDLAALFWVDPRRAPDFAWAWLSRFLLFLGVAVMLTYQVYYLTDHLHAPAAGIGRLMFVSTLITAICVILSSWTAGVLSDRLHRRKFFVLLAAVIYTAGLGIVVLADDLPLFFIGVAVSSIGFGSYMAVDQALVVDVLPDRETDAGKNMGVFNVANAVPQSIAPAVAPFILAIGQGETGNYPLLFAAAALCAFLGALAILPVRGVR